MPKRPVTPPPGDDEPKYLSVYKPYPHNANMELQNDRLDFARWLACCTGTKAFYALYYKPRAWNMVIVEIDQEFGGFKNLLGEHRWSEFLRNPTEIEKTAVTQIFYCLHKTDREAQKEGWKRIDVEENWFKGWSPQNQYIRFPYPETHWCQVPGEARTDKSLCRPLPTQYFPNQKSNPKAQSQKGEKPVVGSEAWVDRSSPSTPGSSGTPQKSAWGNSDSKAHLGKQPTISSTGARSGQQTKPVTLEKAPVPEFVDSTKYPPGQDPHRRPPGASSWGEPLAKAWPDTTPSGQSRSGVKSVSTPYDDILSPSADPENHLADWENIETRTVEWGASGSSSIPESKNLWATDTGKVDTPQTETPPMCNTHGTLCKKGICLDYKKQLRASGKAEVKPATESNRSTGRGRGKGKKGRNGNRNRRGKNAKESDNDKCDLPEEEETDNWRASKSAQPANSPAPNGSGSPGANHDESAPERGEVDGANDERPASPVESVPASDSDDGEYGGGNDTWDTSAW